jgi:hypothetical protein
MAIMNTSLRVFLLFLLSHGSAASTCSLTKGISKLETQYIEDCEKDLSPHGYYAAFFQPCEFSFYKKNKIEGVATNICSSESSVLLGSPKPVNWVFELKKHFDVDDWDSLDSQDIPDYDDLMLWPDQCVGVGPRCYSLESSGEDGGSFSDILGRLFPDGIPNGSTHVQVDCASDAREISILAYNLASGLEKNVGYIVVGLAALCITVTVSLSLCCYGCFRLWFPRSIEKDQKYFPAYYAVPAEVHVDKIYPTTALLEEPEFELSEKNAKYDAI